MTKKPSIAMRVPIESLKEELEDIHAMGHQTIAFGINEKNNSFKMILGARVDDQIVDVMYEFSLESAISLRDSLSEVINELKKKIN